MAPSEVMHRVIHMLFSRSRPQADLHKQISDLRTELAELQVRFANSNERHLNKHAEIEAEHERLRLAFNSFRQRVYAWKKWEPKAGEQSEAQQEIPTQEKEPLDKAAILRAHRSKQ